MLKIKIVKELKLLDYKQAIYKIVILIKLLIKKLAINML